MGLRDTLKSKAASHVRWEHTTLPELGEEVRVKSLMGGEHMVALRASVRGEDARPAMDTYRIVSIAFALHDPQTGERLYNHEVREDLAEIGAFPLEDLNHLGEVMDRLNGKEDKETGNAEETGEKTISLVALPSDSAAA